MADPRHPAKGYPFSNDRRNLLIGNRRDKRLFDPLMLMSNSSAWDDFDQDTINLDYYAVANGGGAAAASFAIQVLEDGVIRGTTGTAGDATASASIIGPKIYYGDRNPLLLARFKLDLVTECRCEIGWIDVVPTSATGASALNSLVTPSVNTSVVDTALYCFNHTGTTTTSGFFTKGASLTAAKLVQATATATISSTTIASIAVGVAGTYPIGFVPPVTITGDGTGATAVATVSGAGAVTAITVLTAGTGYTTATVIVGTPMNLVADTYVVIGIELDARNGVSCWFNGTYIGRMADAVEGGNGVTFWARGGSSNGTGKLMDIDYRWILKDRNI